MPDYIQLPRHRAKEKGTYVFPEATSQSSTAGKAGMFVSHGTNGKVSLATTAGNNFGTATTGFITGQACRGFAAVVDTAIPIIPAFDGQEFIMSLCSNGTGTAYATSYAFDPAASNYCALRNVSSVFVANIASTATTEILQILGPVPGTENDTVPLVVVRFRPDRTAFGAPH